MTTLADTFLEDLDELESSGDEMDESEEEDAAAATAADGADDDDDDDDDDETLQMLADLEDDDDDDEDEDEGGLESRLGAIHDEEGGISSVASLRKSDKYVKHMAEIEKMKGAEPKQAIFETDPEYQLIVESNALVVEIMDEIMAVFKFLCDVYSKKFPELESMVPNPLDYAMVVKRIGNEMDMTTVDLEGVLPQTQIMTVCVTGSTTTGEKLTEANMREAFAASDEILGLDTDRGLILRFVESRMAALAPNLSCIVGSHIAAQLMGQAGGLVALTKIPACNLQVMGQQKQTLGGFSSQAAMKHIGLIFQCALVQLTPPYLRTKACRLVANKSVLAIRCDALQRGSKTNDMGIKLRQQIEAKIEKWQEPKKGKQKKALKAPDDRPARKRGGKRHRREKERMMMTESRKALNRVGFGNQEDEYGDSAMGRSLGMLGKSGMGATLRISKKEKKKKQREEKNKKTAKLYTPGTSGLSSSLAFTPIQGIELVDPSRAEREKRVRQANARYFGTATSFVAVHKARAQALTKRARR